MTRFLLTGGGGFVGQWLARLLIQRGHDATLAGLGSWDTAPAILTPEERGAVRWIATDVRQQANVNAMLDASRPDIIVHLAGIASQPAGDQNPALAYDVNVLGAVRLFAALNERRTAGTLDPTTLIVGTGLQYGIHPGEEQPLTEAAEQRPLTAYAASKTAQEAVALQVQRSSGGRVVCTRSFNHSGAGQSAEYLLPALVRRARALKRDGGRTLSLGNDVLRDYLHVADVAEAYLALAERGRSGEVYNVCSGAGIGVRELAAAVLLRAGVSAEISTAPSLVRATDIPALVGSPAKLMRDTGWSPRKTHADIIDDLLNAATE
jgi:GDP-4-dehydro-6-deoxy-D-mannose reductase